MRGCDCLTTNSSDEAQTAPDRPARAMCAAMALTLHNSRFLNHSGSPALVPCTCPPLFLAMASARFLLLLAVAVALVASADALKKGDGTAYSGEPLSFAARRPSTRRRVHRARRGPPADADRSTGEAALQIVAATTADACCGGRGSKAHRSGPEGSREQRCCPPAPRHRSGAGTLPAACLPAAPICDQPPFMSQMRTRRTRQDSTPASSES